MASKRKAFNRVLANEKKQEKARVAPQHKHQQPDPRIQNMANNATKKRHGIDHFRF